MTKTGYIVWPHLISDEMTNDGPYICTVNIFHPHNHNPKLMYCTINHPDGSTTNTLLYDPATTKEEALNKWLKASQKYMQYFRKTYDTVLDFRTKL